MPRDIGEKLRVLFASETVWMPTIFYSTFAVLYFGNMVVINAKLDVWYFACSTTLITLKLFATYGAARSQIKDAVIRPTVEYHEMLKRLAGRQEMICPRCQIVREADTVHCPVSKRCVARYEGYSWFLAGPVGRGNHGMYAAMVFYVWLWAFLVGWVDARSITVTRCDLPDDETCPLSALCLGCEVKVLHYFSTVTGAFVGFVLFFPSLYYMC